MPRAKQEENINGFIEFKTRDDKLLYVRTGDIPAVKGQCTDNSQTRIFVKDVIEELIVKETPQNVLKKIFEAEGK